VHPIPAHDFSRHLAGAPAGRPPRTRIWRRWTASSLLLGCLLGADAWALALGPAQLQSALGEPLRVSIELPALSAEEAETLQITIANAAAFQAAGLEYKPLLASLLLELETSPPGQARLFVQGREIVNEAFVDLLLQARWQGGQLTRQYRLLLSPARSTPSPSGPPGSAASTPVASTSAGGIALPPASQDNGGKAVAQRPPVAAPPSPSAPAGQKPDAASPRTAAPPPGPLRPPDSSPAEPVAAVADSAPGAKTAMEADTAEPSGSPPPATTTAPPTTAPAPLPAASVSSAMAWHERILQPVWLATTTLLLAGLAGLLIWQRRRPASLLPQAPMEGDAAPASAGPVSSSTAPAVALAASATPAAGSEDALGAEVDPIAEAEVYLAYGRFEQAVEILRDALRQHPAQLVLHLKLLEIAVQRGDRSASEEWLAPIAELTGQAGSGWERAEELMRQLPPEIPAAAAPTDEQPPGQAQDQGLDFEFDLSLPERAAAAATPPAPQAVEPKPNHQGLDFELDLSEIGLKPSPAGAEDSGSRAPAAATNGRTDPDLAFDSRHAIATDRPAARLIQEDNSEPDPLATQMELAEEFMALGDAQGARPLAERVQALATGELQQRARSLLQRLEARPH
jgi:pilus assembly protein FimV